MNKKTTEEPNPIDVHVGRLVRARRKALRISQSELAEALGLSFQQIQKYERGSNRISASKLYEIARTLKVELTTFFTGLDPLEAHDEPFAEFAEFMPLIGAAELARSYALLSIESRRVLRELAATMVRDKSAA